MGRTWYDRHKGYIYSWDRGTNIPEHVRAFEEFHGCMMLQWGDVHHLNGIKTDNRIENLIGMMHGHHSSMHNRGKRRSDCEQRTCIRCGKNHTYSRKEEGRYVTLHYWYAIKGVRWYCHRCYMLLS